MRNITRLVVFGLVASLAGLFSPVAQAYPDEFHCDRWFYTSQKEIRGVLLITHGQNMNPEMFDEMATEFSRRGFDVYRGSFAGHCGTDHQRIYLNLAPSANDPDARKMYAEVERRARQIQKPLFLIANSFSGAIFQTFAKELPFKRRILFAPMLALTVGGYLGQVTGARLGRLLEFSSLTPAPYQANAVSGSAGLAIGRFYMNLWKNRDRMIDQSRTPTLILMDPTDTLIDFNKMKTIVQANHEWFLEPISHAGSTLKFPARTLSHLNVDSTSFGKAEWERIINRSTIFFRDEKSGAGLPATF